jgi:hypothetical protein
VENNRVLIAKLMKSMVGPNGFEPSTSSVSRSRFSVTDRQSTALAATIGVVRNSQERLLDPDWTLIHDEMNDV